MNYCIQITTLVNFLNESMHPKLMMLQIFELFCAIYNNYILKSERIEHGVY